MRNREKEKVNIGRRKKKKEERQSRLFLTFKLSPFFYTFVCSYVHKYRNTALNWTLTVVVLNKSVVGFMAAKKC
jgi:hypothetical protein